MAEEEVTATPFSATITEDEPYSFAAFAAQDVRASVVITHVVYHPPSSMAALEAYYAAHPASPRPAAPPHTHGKVTFAVAEVEDITVGCEQRRTVIGCFPLELSRLSAGDTVAFQYGHEALAPRATDILRGIRIQLDVDGTASLRMRGPGSVFVYGEQLSALIPEWERHRFFTVGDDDEEQELFSDMSEGEMAEMFRRVRD